MTLAAGFFLEGGNLLGEVTAGGNPGAGPFGGLANVAEKNDLGEGCS